MVRFYGWSDQYIEEMDYTKVMEYRNSMEIIESVEQLRHIQASCYADYKKEDQKKITKELNKIIREHMDTSSSKAITTDDFANILARGLNV